jgi:hypothetical protein
MQLSAANTSHSDPLKHFTIGCYLKPDDIGGHSAGSLYKILIFLSRNAKVIDWYKLGLLNEADAWCANTPVYRQLADAVSLLATLDQTFYNASLRRGKVALFSTGASMLWDETIDPTDSTYTVDLQGIHAALIHEGFMVDFVDDGDIERGFLTTRNYELLYITAPNISVAATTKLISWVQQGGNVVVTDGAGLFDEYNTTSLVLDQLLGVTGRTPNRKLALSGNTPQPANQVILPAAAQLPAIQQNIWLDQLTALKPGAATVLYTLKTGQVMLTENKVGTGYAYCFGFLPGRQYRSATYPIIDLNGALRSVDLLDKWRDDYRAFPLPPITLLALKNIPITMEVTLDQKMVEAVVMESGAETLIILFNWSNTVVNDLNIHLATTEKYNYVTNYVLGGISLPTTDATGINFTLGSLQYVEIILAGYRKPPKYPHGKQKPPKTIGIGIK